MGSGRFVAPRAGNVTRRDADVLRPHRQASQPRIVRLADSGGKWPPFLDESNLNCHSAP